MRPPNENGYTPLHRAVYNANPAVMVLLLDRGAEVNGRDAYGMTPLHEAARSAANPAVVTLLLDRGADATLRDNNGKVPVDYAAENTALQGPDVYGRLKRGNVFTD